MMCSTRPRAATTATTAAPGKAPAAGPARRVLFSFRKFGPAAYLGHLDILGVLERSFLRAGYEPAFTQGFNPKPRLEFAHPLPLGVESEEEVAMIALLDFDGPEAFRDRLDRALPPGLRCAAVKALPAPRPADPQALAHGPVLGRGLPDPGRRHGPARRAGREGRRGTGPCWKRGPGRLRVRVPASARPSNILRLLEIAGCADPLSRGLFGDPGALLGEGPAHGCRREGRPGGRVAPRHGCGAKPARGAAGEPVSYFELDLPS